MGGVEIPDPGSGDGGLRVGTRAPWDGTETFPCPQQKWIRHQCGSWRWWGWDWRGEECKGPEEVSPTVVAGGPEEG